MQGGVVGLGVGVLSEMKFTEPAPENKDGHESSRFIL